jgi:hypothetical protein
VGGHQPTTGRGRPRLRLALCLPIPRSHQRLAARGKQPRRSEIGGCFEITKPGTDPAEVWTRGGGLRQGGNGKLSKAPKQTCVILSSSCVIPERLFATFPQARGTQGETGLCCRIAVDDYQDRSTSRLDASKPPDDAPPTNCSSPRCPSVVFSSALVPTVRRGRPATHPRPRSSGDAIVRYPSTGNEQRHQHPRALGRFIFLSPHRQTQAGLTWRRRQVFVRALRPPLFR